jgi:hypothetical protein
MNLEQIPKGKIEKIRLWEGTMSNVLYDPKVCRNIAVDMRYILFLIDKYAKADYLLKELVINN